MGFTEVAGGYDSIHRNAESMRSKSAASFEFGQVWSVFSVCVAVSSWSLLSEFVDAVNDDRHVPRCSKLLTVLNNLGLFISYNQQRVFLW